MHEARRVFIAARFLIWGNISAAVELVESVEGVEIGRAIVIVDGGIGGGCGVPTEPLGRPYAFERL